MPTAPRLREPATTAVRPAERLRLPSRQRRSSACSFLCDLVLISMRARRFPARRDVGTATSHCLRYKTPGGLQKKCHPEPEGRGIGSAADSFAEVENEMF